MRDAGIKSFAFFIFGYPGETPQTMDADDATTRSSSIRTSRTSTRRCRIPGTALYDKCVRDGLLRPSDADWSRMEYSYYLLRGNGLDEAGRDGRDQPREAPLLPAPGYIVRHAGDVARLVTTKRHVVGEILPRLLFGAAVEAPRTAAAVTSPTHG